MTKGKGRGQLSVRSIFTIPPKRFARRGRLLSQIQQDELDTIQKIDTEKMKTKWRIENLPPIDYYHLFNIGEPPGTTKEMYVQRRINEIKEARVKKGEPKSTTEEKEEWQKYYY
jgi:hypothetical protein